MASRELRPSRRAFNGLATAGLASALTGRLASSASAQAPFDPVAVAGEIERLRREANVAGCAVTIVNDGRVVMLQGFGLRDVERNLPVTPETLFPIASTTKAFTSMLAAIGADEGRLRLDDHPRRFVPEFRLVDPTADAQSTLADLMSHTTGVNRNDLPWMMGAIRRPEIIGLLAQTEATAPFRTRMLYNNVMFLVASEAIARANGTTFEGLISQRLLTPLGMTSTRQTLPEFLSAPNRAIGYQILTSSNRLRPFVTALGLDVVAGAGSLISSARDLVNWLFLLADGGVLGGRRFVSQPGFQQLVTPRIALTDGGSYALGWYAYDDGTVTHGGNLGGFSCQVTFVRGTRLAIAVLSNDNASRFPTRATIAILERAFARPAEASASVEAAIHAANRARQDNARQADADPRLNDLVGIYRDWLDEIDIRLLDGRVVLLRGGQPPRPISATGQSDVFTVAGTPTQTLSVRRDNGGDIVQIAINEGGTARAFDRIADDRPTLDDVMAKVLGALGGEMFLRTRRSITLRGTMYVPRQGLVGRIERIHQAPHMWSQSVAFAVAGRPIGVWREYFDGERSGMELGAQPFLGDPGFVEQVRIARRFDPLTTWRQSFSASGVVGKGRIGNEDTVIVAHRDRAGFVERHYYAADSYLLRRIEQLTRDGNEMRVEASATFSDYRQVGGLLMPFREDSLGGNYGRTQIVFEEAVLDVAYDPATFGPRQG